jgi:hypothetical protein
MSDLRLDPKAVDAAAKAAHELERDRHESAGETGVPTWQACLDDPTCWGGENFTLEQVLGFYEAAIRAFLDAMQAEEEQRTKPYPQPGAPSSAWNVTHYRLVTAWRRLDLDGLSADVDELARITGDGVSTLMAREER